ncbi:hypothetical protein LTR94_032670, partial [Friedmanniomyces endolithicus]
EVADVIADVRRRDEARLDLDLTGGLKAGAALMRGNMPTPQPTPYIKPHREGRLVNEDEAPPEAVIEPAAIDLAKRAYDHGWRLDPIVRSLLDTDFYKLLMLQLIWRRFRDVPVSFSVINRTTSVQLAEEVDEAELRAQLDHARSLRFTNRELI